MSRRDAIRMDAQEIDAFLDERRVLTLATLGRNGWPHLMPLWYVRGLGSGQPHDLWAWTYGKSQKVRNLERDTRCTIQVEAGEAYAELRGVMFRARAVVHRDIDTVTSIGTALTRRYGGGDLTEEMEAAMRAQAAKRIGLSFEILHTASWDHRKLGGTY